MSLTKLFNQIPCFDGLLMGYHVVRYHLTLSLQYFINLVLQLFNRPRFRSDKSLTVFISSLNTLGPLKLTIQSLVKYNQRTSCQFIFGENASTDGSREYLEHFCQLGGGELILADEPRPHGTWLDLAIKKSQTPYTAFVDSDILFFSGDLLGCAIDYLEAQPECWLLAADRRPGSAYPFDSEVYCPESLSTWLVVFRTDLRNHLHATFLGQHGSELGSNGKPLKHYECGALVLEEMRHKNLRYDIMPAWMRIKFHHFGSLSWVHSVQDQTTRYAKMKKYIRQDIEQRIRYSTFN